MAAFSTINHNVQLYLGSTTGLEFHQIHLSALGGLDVVIISPLAVTVGGPGTVGLGGAGIPRSHGSHTHNHSVSVRETFCLDENLNTMIHWVSKKCAVFIKDCIRPLDRPILRR